MSTQQKRPEINSGPITSVAQIPLYFPNEIALLKKPGPFIETVLQFLTTDPASNK